MAVSKFVYEFEVALNNEALLVGSYALPFTAKLTLFIVLLPYISLYLPNALYKFTRNSELLAS